MCSSTVVPILKFFSHSDQTHLELGITCRKLAGPVAGTSWRDLFSANKVAQLIEGEL